MPLHRDDLEKWLELGKPFEEVAGPERPAAVLVPLGWNSESRRDEILLTKRTDLVQTHKGQISFPGGMWETGDADLRATALRETQEEIGLAAAEIDIVGRLPMVLTRGALPIVPWVGLTRFPLPMVLNEHEVARALWLPVDRLLDEGLKPMRVAIGTIQVESIGIEVDGELVWGATARILELLREVVKRGLP
jgi:8-oxo-dGTP pyrophosphatase MutT (NUDIX family)